MVQVTESVWLIVEINKEIIEIFLQYLEIRFNRGVRILISLIFVVDVVLYQAIVVYVPSLALNQGIKKFSIHSILTAPLRLDI